MQPKKKFYKAWLWAIILGKSFLYSSKGMNQNLSKVITAAHANPFSIYIQDTYCSYQRFYSVDNSGLW